MPHNQPIALLEIRCVSCGKLIAKGRIDSGMIEIPCKCGVKTTVQAEKKPEGRVDAHVPGSYQTGQIRKAS